MISSSFLLVSLFSIYSLYTSKSNSVSHLLMLCLKNAILFYYYEYFFKLPLEIHYMFPLFVFALWLFILFFLEWKSTHIDIKYWSFCIAIRVENSIITHKLKDESIINNLNILLFRTIIFNKHRLYYRRNNTCIYNGHPSKFPFINHSYYSLLVIILIFVK